MVWAMLRSGGRGHKVSGMASALLTAGYQAERKSSPSRAPSLA